MKKLIVISDWASDSFAAQEVRTAVEGFLGDPSSPNISFVTSTSSTIHTSFLISQLTHIEQEFGRPLETVIYVDTDSAGAEFVVVHLASGIYLCGPNSGNCFSMIKSQIEELYVYRGLEEGTQFRSRDNFPRIIAALMDAKQDDLDLEEVSSNSIPVLEGFYIGHIDAFGKIKTTIPAEWFNQKYKYDDMVTLKINDTEKKVRFVNTASEGKPGEAIIYLGTSGEKSNPYMEVSTADMHTFSTPLPGNKVEVL